jgi:hypothetical protein
VPPCYFDLLVCRGVGHRIRRKSAPVRVPEARLIRPASHCTKRFGRSREFLIEKNACVVSDGKGNTPEFSVTVAQIEAGCLKAAGLNYCTAAAATTRFGLDLFKQATADSAPAQVFRKEKHIEKEQAHFGAAQARQSLVLAQ